LIISYLSSQPKLKLALAFGLPLFWIISHLLLYFEIVKISLDYPVPEFITILNLPPNIAGMMASYKLEGLARNGQLPDWIGIDSTGGLVVITVAFFYWFFVGLWIFKLIRRYNRKKRRFTYRS